MTTSTRFTSTKQWPKMLTLSLPLTKPNTLLALLICSALTVGVMSIFITFYNIQNMLVAQSSGSQNHQQFMTKPANKRQLIATLQSLRMHNVTRYQRFSVQNRQLTQNTTQRIQRQQVLNSNAILPAGVEQNLVTLDKLETTISAWNNVDQRHNSQHQLSKALATFAEPVQKGW